MTEEQFHSGLVWAIFLIAVVSFSSLLVLAAPYGRYYSGKGWGPHISNRASWVIMELPSAVLFLCIFLSGSAAFQTVPLVLLGVWQCHYLNRTFVYPTRIRTAGKKMPLLVMACGFVFNSI
ncbi:MAG: 3-oxo-5-alpha-steroid 4-dehydrogenase, partial [Candidatus Aminicenantes bacterium]|nr:3-oxo-5-alpha-steroid 4-dehydrogenase [Candidatus Aminicenantes bacterium]